MLQQASNYSYCAINLHFCIKSLKKWFDNFEDFRIFPFQNKPTYLCYLSKSYNKFIVVYQQVSPFLGNVLNTRFDSV